MDFSFTEAQLMGWLQMALWPLFRIGGMTMVMPLIGERTTPVRVRLMFTLGLTLAIAPVLPAQPVIEMFTAAWWLRSLQEVVLGVVIGYVMKLVFEIAMLAGEVIGNSMGLGFAQMVDPVRGTSAPVLGSFYVLFFSLLFVTLGGHLQMIRLMVASFELHAQPGSALSPEVFAAIAGFVGHTFAGAMRLALPLVAALMLVNLGFGVMSRAAPALNALSVGFPLSLIAGLVLLWLTLPSVPGVFEAVMLPAIEFLRALTGGE